MKINSVPRGIFVTGTDTGVGKTLVAASICAGSGAGYWKPIQAGTKPFTDSERVEMWSALPKDHIYPERYVLKLPASPHTAAEAENITIKREDFRLPEIRQQRLVVEGAGGLLVPINRKEMILDLIVMFDLPVLLVARPGLGTINHTLMSLRILQDSGAKLWGVILSGHQHQANEEAIRYFGKPDFLFSFPHIENPDPEKLKSAFDRTFIQHASS